MNNFKKEILDKICYSDLIYERINKKLNKQFTKVEIENMILETLKETNESQYQKTGKNIYLTNNERNIRITVNSNTYRIITVDTI
jgi:hypothetical protein